MTTIVILVGIIIYLLFFRYFGGYVAKNIIKANDNNPTPAHKINDGVDFVPTRKEVLFGHHFASIAGAAPIIGPVIALAWGWLPALIWVWGGNIFIGAIHDYLALMASVRRNGASIQFIAADIFGKSIGKYIQWFVFFLLILVIAAFSAITGGTFVSHPDVASAYFFTVASALLTGFLMYRIKMNFKLATLIGIVLLIFSFYLGMLFPIKFSYNVWIFILFLYIVIASALPVDILLQPRDYLNSWLLYFGIVLGVIGAVGSFHKFLAPAYTAFSANIVTNKPSPLWPILPLIIACGALSGFHSLVASGTTSKQLDKESDGLFIGFGSMLTEGLLSTIVIAAISSFGYFVLKEHFGADLLKWSRNYLNLVNDKTIGGPIAFFSASYSRMVNSSISVLPIKLLEIFSAIWIASFALTTLDTTNRLCRYLIVELSTDLKKKSEKLYSFFSNKWISSLIPALLGIILAGSGKYKIIWPVFGAANQLLASIALITGTVWAVRESRLKKNKLIIIPPLFLWVTVTTALFWYMFFILPGFFNKNIIQAVLLFIITLAMAFINLMLAKDFILKLIKRESDA